jgi:hypothetical protein
MGHWFDEKAKALEIGIVLYDSNLWGLKIGSLVFKEWIKNQTSYFKSP